jgi:hypothetical protein
MFSSSSSSLCFPLPRPHYVFFFLVLTMFSSSSSSLCFPLVGFLLRLSFVSFLVICKCRLLHYYLCIDFYIPCNHMDFNCLFQIFHLASCELVGEISGSLTMKIIFYWDVTPFCFVDVYRRFGTMLSESSVSMNKGGSTIVRNVRKQTSAGVYSVTSQKTNEEIRIFTVCILLYITICKSDRITVTTTKIPGSVFL